MNKFSINGEEEDSLSSSKNHGSTIAFDEALVQYELVPTLSPM